MSARVPPESQFTNYVDYADAIRRAGYSQRWSEPRPNDSRPQARAAQGASEAPASRAEARPTPPG
jgi:hypothetical protein